MDKNWDGIIVHCSDSDWGDALVINDWHRDRGWQGCGYHFVITNGSPRKDELTFFSDGQIEIGRGTNMSGAHAHGYNSTHIGICLIGKKKFTFNQMQSLEYLVNWLRDKYEISTENIIGHRDCENNGGKLCPNFDVKEWVLDTL